MKFKYIIIAFIIGASIFLVTSRKAQEFNYIAIGDEDKFWKVQSIDTMKYSRDLSREMLWKKSFDAVMDAQMAKIAATGATHAAIGTPYDAEFKPILKRWVDAARKYKLKVWFRGNWSGWEGWFGYSKIGRADHLWLTERFILNNKDLFEDGDIFTACPECENGGPGDPRHNNDLWGHRNFLISEYKKVTEAFKKIGKDVEAGYHSMNGDVARLVMNKETTKALGGVVAVDHYVGTPQKLIADIKNFAQISGGKVVLAEFGAPIPDIHGNMSQKRQAEWIEEALRELAKMPEVEGLNYWTSVGGSTELWDGKGTPVLAAGAVEKFYNPKIASGFVTDKLDKPIAGARVESPYGTSITSNNGRFRLSYPKGEEIKIKVSAGGYFGRLAKVNKMPEGESMTIALEKEAPGLTFRLVYFLRNIFKF